MPSLLSARDPDEQILVIGQFVDQLREIAARLHAPVLSGTTGQTTRERIFAELRAGEASPVCEAESSARTTHEEGVVWPTVSMRRSMDSDMVTASRVSR